MVVNRDILLKKTLQLTSKTYFNQKYIFYSMGNPFCGSTLRKLIILTLVFLEIFNFSGVNALTTINYVTTNLSNNHGNSLNQKLARSDGYTYIVWTDTSNSSNDN